MNFNRACELLDICSTDEITKETIKRQYKMKALTYHPDKNHAPDAPNKFIQINESYEYLMNRAGSTGKLTGENECDEDGSFSTLNSYKDMMKSFIFTLSSGNANSSIFQTILQNISNMCESNALELCEKLDKNILINTYKILFKHKHIFHISDEFLNNISQIIKTRTFDDECIILNPSLSDLYNNNVYKLIVNRQTFLIPLWQHELVYDNSGNEVIVKCYPIMPEDMEIDVNNNIRIHVSYQIQTLLETDVVYVECYTHKLPIYTNTLKIKRSQQVIFAKQGIPKLNMVNIYDITNISDVIVIIHLHN